MLKTKLAKKLLTKKEQKHLTEMGINSMAQMKNQAQLDNKAMESFKANSGSLFAGCWKCREIVHKLGLTNV